VQIFTFGLLLCSFISKQFFSEIIGSSLFTV